MSFSAYNLLVWFSIFFTCLEFKMNFIQKMFGNAFHERIHLVIHFEVDWKGISGLSSRYALTISCCVLIFRSLHGYPRICTCPWALVNCDRCYNPCQCCLGLFGDESTGSQVPFQSNTYDCKAILISNDLDFAHPKSYIDIVTFFDKLI